MPRIEVIRLHVLYMQVCAVADATDPEILDVCNRENPAGTTLGWTHVLRDGCEPNQVPVQCTKYPERMHFLVGC